MFMAVLFIVVKIWKDLSVCLQMNRQRKCDIYVYNGVLVNIKKEENPDLPGGSVVGSPPANSGDQVLIRVWEDSICLGATEHMCCKRLRLPTWSLALQQEKPGHCN